MPKLVRKTATGASKASVRTPLKRKRSHVGLKDYLDRIDVEYR
ncbi:MAG: hypothetical protein ACRD2Y_12800 [Terriglobales bacterium]